MEGSFPYSSVVADVRGYNSTYQSLNVDAPRSNYTHASFSNGFICRRESWTCDAMCVCVHCNSNEKRYIGEGAVILHKTTHEMHMLNVL